MPRLFPAVLVTVALLPIPATTVESAGEAPLTYDQAKTDWRKELKTKLEERYPLAKLNFMETNIRTPGAVVLLMQANVLAEKTAFYNTVKDGVLQAPGKSGFMSDLLRQAQNNDATRDRVSLPLYQPVFVTEVRVTKDSLLIEVATGRQFIQESVDRAAIARFVDGTSVKGDTLTKTDVSVRKATLEFEFAKGTLETLPVEQVVSVIEKMLLRADDPKAPQFGKISIGMTRDQVITNLGKPTNVVDLGGKEILVYANIKVTLVDGKVTDVQ